MQSVNFENQMNSDIKKFERSQILSKAPKELDKFDEQPNINHTPNESPFNIKESPFDVTEIEHIEGELQIDSVVQEEPLKKINNGIVILSVNFENRMKTCMEEFDEIDEEPDITDLLNEDQSKVKDSSFEVNESELTQTELFIDHYNSKFRNDDLLDLSYEMPCEAVEIDRKDWLFEDQVKNMAAKVIFLTKKFNRIKEKQENEIKTILRLIQIERNKYQTTSSKKFNLAITSIKDFTRFKKLVA